MRTRAATIVLLCVPLTACLGPEVAASTITLMAGMNWRINRINGFGYLLPGWDA